MGDYKTNLDKCLKEGVECFRRKYGGDPSIAVSAPGRVNLIGEHTDYNDGYVLPMALPMMTVIVGRKSDSKVCEVTSTAISDKKLQCQRFSVPPHPGDEEVTIEAPLWIQYVRGVVALMNTEGDVPAFEAVITTCVPLGGGLSSSASLEVATGLFVEQLLGRTLPRKEDLALICQQAEHRYAGNKCGIMDQFISAMAEKGYALMIDCEQPLKEECVQQIPLNDPELVVLVIDTGVRHELAGGEYNKRRAACENAVAKLKLGVKSLRFVSMQQLRDGKKEKEKDLTDLEFRRAYHVISEIERTEDAAVALGNGKFEDFGKLMNSSHDSLKDNYEVSCPELNALVELARADRDVYGSRMTGGGFGGCTVTLLPRAAVSRVKAKIKEEYRAAVLAQIEKEKHKESKKPNEPEPKKPKKSKEPAPEEPKEPIFYEASASPGAGVITTERIKIIAQHL